MAKTDKDVEDLKKALTAPRKKESPIPSKDLLSSGSTMLNLACSGRPSGAFAKGRYYFLVGDSDSGKTWISHTTLAEAANNPNFDDYDLIFDDVEGGALMDIRSYFGKKLARRIQPPPNGHSVVLEDFLYNMDDLHKKKRKVVYILDSMDALSSNSEKKTLAAQKAASKGGKVVPGSMGDGKAKKNSSGLRVIKTQLLDTGSILIIVGQTRDVIQMGWMPPGASVGPKKTFSGGHAMKFYAALQLWTSTKGSITKEVMGRLREIGTHCRVKVMKNRLTGKKTSKDEVVDIPIYRGFGIDDVGSCVDFLLLENHWEKKKGGIIEASEFEFSGTREKLIKHIEASDEESLLRKITARLWNKIEEACQSSVERKARYT